MSQSFYQTDGELFIATANTIGPWSEAFQHAGPPSALLLHQLLQQAEGMHPARFQVELLKPVPVRALQLSTQEITPGKRRRVLQAELVDAQAGQTVARAQLLLLRRESISLGDLPNHDGPQPPAPEQCAPFAFNFFTAEVGYHTAMELRLASGGLGSGKTQMWMRPRIDLLPGVPCGPLERIPLVGDSGNGISMVIDPRKIGFANPDLSLNIRRPPQSDWLCLDAHTHLQDFGIGLAESRIWDAAGVVANGNQNLLLTPNA